MKASPWASVVVPIDGRRNLLLRVLCARAHRSVPADTLVVWDTDSTPLLLSSFGGALYRSGRWLDGQAPAVARFDAAHNAGRLLDLLRTVMRRPQ